MKLLLLLIFVTSPLTSKANTVGKGQAQVIVYGDDQSARVQLTGNAAKVLYESMSDVPAVNQPPNGFCEFVRLKTISNGITCAWSNCENSEGYGCGWDFSDIKKGLVKPSATSK